jgi:pyruvate/2-oxoglutarate dehydrogenase complex dihydrolipoamide acyltransferase (E2) component
MTYTVRPYDKQREYTYHFLSRMKKFNCPVSANCEFDVTETVRAIQARREAGHDIGLISFFAKAAAKTIEAHPRLNERLFHTLFRKIIATYDTISAGMLAERQAPDGSYILLPLIIDDAPQQSIATIHRKIREIKTAPLETIEAYQKLQRLLALPRWVVPLAQFFFRTHPRYTVGQASTFSISSVLLREGVLTGGYSPVFQTTFFPVNLVKRPAIHDGQIVERDILHVVLSVDHYLVDGMEVHRAIETLRALLESPDALLADEPSDANTEVAP